MFLPVLFHLVLDEAECPVDDLLIKLQFSLLLIQVFHRALNFHWVEVEQLVLLLEHFEQALSLHALMQDNILNFACCSNLLLILFLHLLHLVSYAIDVLIVGADAVFGFPFLFSNGLFDLLFL